MSEWKLDISRVNNISNGSILSALILYAWGGASAILSIDRSRGKNDKLLQNLFEKSLVVHDHIPLPEDLVDFLQKVSKGEDVDPDSIKKDWANILHQISTTLKTRYDELERNYLEFMGIRSI